VVERDKVEAFSGLCDIYTDRAYASVTMPVLACRVWHHALDTNSRRATSRSRARALRARVMRSLFVVE
jgi:hypothetical protein